MEFCDKEHCSENGDEVVGILASYSVGTWFEFLCVDQLDVRFVCVSFLSIQENSVTAVAYRNWLYFSTSCRIKQSCETQQATEYCHAIIVLFTSSFVWKPNNETTWYAVFWGITQRRMVILDRRFGTAYRYNLKRSDPWKWDRYAVPKRL
jgi:hypothetical protein